MAGGQETILDSFASLQSWKAVASDGVTARVQASESPHGPALRLDFDFKGTAGFASAQRPLPIAWPENFELTFWMRAEAPANNLEVKLVDASGDNVWWFNRRDYAFAKEWRLVRIKKRQVDFAWGPASDRALRHTEKLEFVVSAGHGGGSGTIEIAGLQLREVPPVPAQYPALSAHATSSRPGSSAQDGVDGDRNTAWRPDPAAGERQTFTADLGLMREFGGIVVSWKDGLRARRYDVSASDDGTSWRLLRSIAEGAGESDALLLPDEEARYLRLDLHESSGNGYALSELAVKDLAFGASPNAFFEAIARDAPRGYFPRGFSGEQTYWTLVGVDGGAEASALISEDGAVELGPAGPSIEPYVLSGDRLVTWADVSVSQALSDGYLPTPSVTWRSKEWTLTITAFAREAAGKIELVVSYAVANLTDRKLPLELVLAARPFQVNPPTQFLNITGGISPIHEIGWDGLRLRANGKAVLVPLTAPTRFAATSFEAGFMPQKLLQDAKDEARVEDPSGFASGAFVYPLELAPHETRTLGFVAPLRGELEAPDLGNAPPGKWLEAEAAKVKADWRQKLGAIDFDVPEDGRRLVDSLRTALAHILMSRGGVILRPGTRAYSRSWIRDGAMMGEALARLGQADAAARYLRWYMPFQFANGKVPCCVDHRGADPVPENDSHGELIFLAAEAFRYTNDRTLLEAAWPHVTAAVRYMDELRASQRTPQNETPERRMLFGLLPPSISHEGYSAKPAYSYWDVFWSLLGYKDAAFIAAALGKTAEARAFQAAHDEFARDVRASLSAAARVHSIAYVPGAADLGDFDATSTTIALSPAGEASTIPKGLLHATFEQYWQNFVTRRDGPLDWNAYTPYELRTIGTFVRLGWRERAHELLDFFFADQRPAAWNQWAEVVGRQPRQPRFIGDMPHAWIASDYIRSALDMFAYEREGDRAIVVLAGIERSWFTQGFAVKHLRTPYGTLDLSVRREGEQVILALGGDARPPGGFAFLSPWAGQPAARLADGTPLDWHNGELTVPSLPARIEIAAGSG
jgi:hypothetical protein